MDVRFDDGWVDPLPRLGVHIGLPSDVGQVEWYGLGPGESYRDSCRAARVGRWAVAVDDLQTPYVLPQENGHRTGVRWAVFSRAHGGGLRVAGDPVFGLTARRWSSADLDAARHTTDLVAGDRVHVDLDLAQHGLGTGSCGPDVLPRHHLHPAPARLRIGFSPTGPHH